MKKLLLGLVLVSMTLTDLPVMAQVTSVMAQKSSNDICSVAKTGFAHCDSNIITTANNNLSQLNLSSNWTDSTPVCPPDQPEGYVQCHSIVVTSAHVCPLAQPEGYARCHSMVLTNNSPAPLVGNLPHGYSPSDFLNAYQLTDAANTSTSTTIAIIDAYDSPKIESDLATYSLTYGLPACTTANGCFKKVNQRGDSNPLPSPNPSWGLEISLDVEIAHAICKNCKILLVEADTNSYLNLGTAVNQAVKMGANVILNPYGGTESQKEAAYDRFYNHPGVAIVVSSGDSGYGVQYPAASPYVTAVGGTTLVLNSDGTWNYETVWGGSGSGCSTLEPKPRWQPDRLCKFRTVADVAADADPNTGAAVYDSTYGQGWLTVGGTSLSATIIAGTYALSGNSSSLNGASHIYTNSSIRHLHNITSGTNGTCNNTYLCNALYGYTQYGYNGPTGFGTPINTNAF